MNFWKIRFYEIDDKIATIKESSILDLLVTFVNIINTKITDDIYFELVYKNNKLNKILIKQRNGG